MKDRLVYKHEERHFVSRTGWLRAAVLGANDGIISVSSLVIGVASAAPHDTQSVLLTGVAGLVAGAMSMAAGEYISVSSQSDLEKADLARERKELVEIPDLEWQELTDLYVDRGVAPELAREVVKQMCAKDALGTHAREELGITTMTAAKPLQAAMASALSFVAGAIFPVLAVFLFPSAIFVTATAVLCLCLLGLLGMLAARAGGAPVWFPALRVVIWGAAAMAFTALVGHLLSVNVA